MHRRLALLALAALLTACAAPTAKSPSATFDFGPLPPDKPLAVKRLIIYDVTAPTWMDSNRIYYRLNYADAAQPAAYANSRWVSPLSQLLTQRVKARAAQGGTVVAGAEGFSGGLRDAQSLKLDIDEFTHQFANPKESKAVVRVRATLLNGREIQAQRTFSQDAIATMPDANSGAKALIAAADGAMDAALAWVAGGGK